MVTLYQFQFSHFCEKARWALDYKGVPYTVKNLLPGPHASVVKKLSPKNGLPIIVDDGKIVQDSTAIITYLDQKVRDRPLTPRDGRVAKDALEWEEYLDEEVGVTLRCWFYYHALPDRSRSLKFLLDGAPWYGGPMLSLTFPVVRSAMRKAMDIQEKSAERSQARFEAAIHRIDNTLSTRPFLAGDQFSRADLTACALLQPWMRPGETDDEASRLMPEPVAQLRAKYKTTRAFRHVAEMYDSHRQRSASALTA